MLKTPNDEPQTEQREPTPIDYYHYARQAHDEFERTTGDKLHELKNVLLNARQQVFGFATKIDPAGEDIVLTTSDADATYVVSPRNTEIRPAKLVR